MKLKTSITLTNELVRNIDLYGKNFKNRSDFIEAAIWAYINQLIRNQQNLRDLEIINNNVDRLNAEALEVLEYQAKI